jgi:tetratricopeptide (TPR) repeat protein
MPFVVGEQVGPYRIVEQLGQGGMSTVYKAYHAALDRYVALKVLHAMFKGDRSFLERFQREARIVARLEHPHIVPVYDFSEHEGIPYLVMRYVQGRTLKALVNEQGALPLARIIEILRPVCDALEYAHGQGVLHRDIKPSNVLISQDGRVFVTDYGLAKMVQTGDSTISQDRMIGTPQYISPEQAKGETLDARTDLYSLGVVLFEMVTGRVPYMADTPFAIVHDHIFSPLPLPSQVNPAVPQAVEQVILKALAKSPADRYQSAGDLFRALTAAAQSLGDIEAAGALPLAAAATGPQAATPPSTLSFPVAGAERVDTPAAGEAGGEEQASAAPPSPLAELASAVGAAVSAGLAEAKPGLDKVRSEVTAGLSEAREKLGAGLSEAARSIRASAPTPSALTPPPSPLSPESPAPPVPPEPAVPAAADAPATAPKKRKVRWPLWVGLGVVGLILLLLLWRTVGPVLRQRGEDRRATAAAQNATPLPQQPSEPPPPPPGEIEGEPFPIRTGEDYLPPGAISMEEGESQLRLLDDSLNREPGNAVLYLERGNVLFMLEHFVEADDAYRRAIELDPKMPWAHYNRGVTLLYLRRAEEALGEFQWLMDATGGRVEPPVLFNLGLAHAMAGHRLEAVASFREFLRQWPDEDLHRRQALDLLRRLENQ